MFLYLGTDAPPLHHHGVGSTIVYRLAARDDIRRNVLVKSGARLYHDEIANMSACALYDRRGENHAVANHAVAGYFRAVAKDVMVAHLGVMAYVRALHQEVVIADNGLSTGVGGAVYNHIFTENIVVADDKMGFLASVAKVLWLSSKHRTLVYLVVIAHPRAIEYADKWKDHAVVSNLDVVLDVSEWVYFATFPNLGIGRNHGLWTNFF